jgi:Na+/proline symporter
MTSTADTTTSRAPRVAPTRRATATAIAVAAVGSMVVNAVIAAIARGPLDVSSEFQPLTAPVFLMWTLIGTVVGGLVWRAITRRSAHPAGLLRKLVPAVVLVSLVPDLLVYLDGSMPGTTGTAVWALVAMHLATAAVSVPAFQRFMPAAD